MSRQGTKGLIHPIDFCCINCSDHGSITEIHIYTAANVFERSITILDALCELFASPQLLLTQAENLDATMCNKCAESVSCVYQAYTTLLSLSSANSYLCKAISHFQKICYGNIRTRDEAHIVGLEEMNENGFEDDTVSVTSDLIVAANVLKIELDKSDAGKQKPGILRKGKAHSKNSKNTTKADITEDLAQALKLTPAVRGKYSSSNKKRIGGHICRNINKRRFFKCRECPAQFIPVFELHDHILTVHEQKVKQKCPNCPFTYHSEIYKYETHRCITTDEPKTAKKLQPYMCEICGLRFGGRRLLNFHKEKIHSQESIRYTCHYCQKKLIDRHKLYTHIELHTETQSYLCNHCGKCFSQKRGLYKHLKIHVPDCDSSLEEQDKHGKNRVSRLQERRTKEVGQFLCDACSKVFIYKRNLREHIKKIHDLENCKYKCPVCDKPHWTRHRLEKHIPTHIPKPESTISERMRKKMYRTRCKAQGVSQKSGLDNHIEIHALDGDLCSTENHDQKVHQFPCDACNKVFIYKRNLREHVKKIHDLKNCKYKCPVCEKPHWSRQRLEKHIPTHNPKPEAAISKRWRKRLYPVQRKLQLQSFSQKQSLDKHIKFRVHDRDWRLQGKRAGDVGHFPCDACNKVFKYKKSLREHIKKIHNLETCKYKCPVCEKPHWTRQRLEKHIQVRHYAKPESEISKRMRTTMRRAQPVSQSESVRNENIAFACSLCSKQFENVSTLMEHEEFMHADPSSSCTLDLNQPHLTSNYVNIESQLKAITTHFEAKERKRLVISLEPILCQK